MLDIPRIISVDDHVVEPPDLWTARITGTYADRAPRVERDKAKFNFEGGVFSFEKGAEDGEWCDWWIYADQIYPFPKLSAAVGFDVPSVLDESPDNARQNGSADRQARDPGSGKGKPVRRYRL